MESMRQNSKVRIAFDPMNAAGAVMENFGAHVGSSNQEVDMMNRQALVLIATLSCIMIGQHDVKEGKCAADVLRELKREVNNKRRPDK